MGPRDWQLRIDPEGLLRAHQPTAAGHEFRLFACACARQVWQHIDDEDCRAAVEQAERYARGDATRRELREAFSRAHSSAFLDDETPWPAVSHYARCAAALCAEAGPYTLAN